MYAVIELQQDGSTLSALSFTYVNKNDAEQKYHEVLAYAAKSSLVLHSAALLNEDGRELRYEFYRHGVGESEE